MREPTVHYFIIFSTGNGFRAQKASSCWRSCESEGHSWSPALINQCPEVKWNAAPVNTNAVTSGLLCISTNCILLHWMFSPSWVTLSDLRSNEGKPLVRNMVYIWQSFTSNDFPSEGLCQPSDYYILKFLYFRTRTRERKSETSLLWKWKNRTGSGLL